METQKFKFAAKLLFQFRVVGSDGASNIMRTCEERIILIHAETSRSALVIAKQRGKSAKHHYKNSNGDDVLFEFVGVMDLLHLGLECEEDEVWYSIASRKLPMERASAIIPKESELSAIRNGP